METTATNLDPNRPWFKRWTAIGTILAGGATAAETVGAIPPGTTVATVNSLAQIAGAALALLGIYRQVAAVAAK